MLTISRYGEMVECVRLWFSLSQHVRVVRSSPANWLAGEIALSDDTLAVCLSVKVTLRGRRTLSHTATAHCAH